MQYQKVKSAGKVVLPKGDELSAKIEHALGTAADVVGATLGPVGRPVLLERGEHNLPPIITKDGVTVFRALGFEDSTSQVILEAARDCAIRTANEAGDGTTTATVLAHAIVRHATAYTNANPRVGAQRVARYLEKAFGEIIEPAVKEMAVSAVIPAEEDGEPADQSLLWRVAKTSANGDGELADRIIECYDIVGDDGNVTIQEAVGPSGYEVEPIDGYPVGSGYEESCGRFFPKFVNDPANQRCLLPSPMFLLYHGRINDIQQLSYIFNHIWNNWQNKGARYNLVVVATGFSENVLGNLAATFADPSSMNPYPLLLPQSIDPNGQFEMLKDIAALTGATVLDPLNAPIEQADYDHLGCDEGITSFEATRFRSTIVGRRGAKDPDQNDDGTPFFSEGREAIMLRADEIKAQVGTADSELMQILLRERLGKLTGGIARLRIMGASNGETKEKRDRAEDAVCAVRGAMKHGCLPGGGHTLLALAAKFGPLPVADDEKSKVLAAVLYPALRAPVERIFANAGYTEDEIKDILDNYGFDEAAPAKIYDAVTSEFVDAFEAGIVDSVPAVLEAVRNSLSIAALLGTLGGTVCFQRDKALERVEAREVIGWLKDAGLVK